MYKKKIIALPLHLCGGVFCFLYVFFCIVMSKLHGWNVHFLLVWAAAWFFLPFLIRVINHVDSGIIERKGKSEIHGNMNANCSLQSLPFEGHNITCNRYIRCELSICLSISLASLKKQLVIVVPHVTKVWIQAGHPYWKVCLYFIKWPFLLSKNLAHFSSE